MLLSFESLLCMHNIPIICDKIPIEDVAVHLTQHLWDIVLSAMPTPLQTQQQKTQRQENNETIAKKHTISQNA